MPKETNGLQPLAVGQIRKLRPLKQGASSRLVLIVERDKLDGTLLVYLISNLVDAAIPRDLCLSRNFTDGGYEIVVMTDYFSRAIPENFEIENVFGQVDTEFLDRMRRIVFSNPFGKLPDEVLTEGVRLGEFPVQKYDSVWQHRTREFHNFSELTYLRDPISTDHGSRCIQTYVQDPDPESIEKLPHDALFALCRTGSW